MRVLVVEDDRRLAGPLVRGLTAEGFVVDVEYDGRDGLWRSTEYAYDVIVLDVMLTAKDGEPDRAEGLDSGAGDYLTKSLSQTEITVRSVGYRLDSR
ncbi:hypothetical protein AB0A74_00745 [Saccharothrix sp. NPDC042600]|uniref:hypothetical protein n=1 Tax=Saccharothrix TaxID=2071 RepID=UPI0033F812E9